MKKIFYFTLIIITIIINSCGPIPDIRDLLEVDIIPPQFQCIKTLNTNQIELVFNEKTILNQQDLYFKPALTISTIQAKNNSLIINCLDMKPGQEYTLETMVKDENGNGLTFIATFYGFNPAIPELVINEFTTQGSASHPDIVELFIKTDGEMGGVTIYQGTKNNFKDQFIFPQFTVKAGDFILIHFKPQGITEEIDETQKKDISGGLDASDNAFDFWIKQGTGISGNNGVISLYTQPNGKIIDGVLYSNRTSNSDTKYRGFGTKATMERADELNAEQAWICEQELIRPEDGINPDDSTATRSMCRDSSSADSDAKTDWHIVPTKGASFGLPNSDEVYGE